MLVPLFRPLCTLTIVHMRRWVIQLLELGLAKTLMRSKDSLALNVFQFRHPLTDKVAIRIALLCLRHRIENGIARLPALRIIRHIPINEVLGEIALPATIINQQVAAQV